MKKIVIACDSFKGSLTSKEVAEAASEGVNDAFVGVRDTLEEVAVAKGVRDALGEDIEVLQVAVADGGEGTAEALAQQLGGEMQTVLVCDPLFRPVEAHYAIVEQADKRIAVMEMAEASGLTLIPVWVRHPIATTTYGVGEMLLDALRKGCTEVLMGIGGSATNDAGMGMLTALGWRFYDAQGEELAGVGGNLDKVVRIDDSAVPEAVRALKITVACDVDTPFVGEKGATRVFAPQKGADEETVEELEAGMLHFAQLAGLDKEYPGSGAAGGLGGALRHFLHAQLTAGAELVLDTIGFDSLLVGADLVLTGEGKMDSQTLTGKTPLAVMQRAKKAGVPVVGICGKLEDRETLLEAGFADLRSINKGCDKPLQELMRKEVAQANIRQTVKAIVEERL